MMEGCHMDLTVKSFDELTTYELYDIYRLRAEVFVVEQNCVYLDVDDHDKASLHVVLRDNDGIAAYLRVLPAGEVFPEPSLGRVIAVKRRQGLGTRIVSEGIRLAQERFGAEAIRIEAQIYARGLYEKLGFRQVSDEFLDDGIPHIEMLWQKDIQ